MRTKKFLLAPVVAVALLAASAAQAVDGCAVLLCLVKGGSGYNECKGILKEFYKDTALGKPPPRCKKGSAPSLPAEVTSQEGYSSASAGAGSSDASPYGGKITTDQYATATQGAATAAVTAQAQADAGVRTVDTTALTGTDTTSAATGANEASADAAASVAANDCTTGCEVTPDPTLVDDDIKTEVTADLVAQGLIPDPALASATPDPSTTISTSP